jgi:acetoin:2,6-dichlorophenolindophenol oxidoreductase subunit alpha
MDPETLYEKLILIRSFEERLLALFSEGKLFGTVHTCLGQESDAVGVVTHLAKEDILFSNHRGHGHYIIKTGDVDRLMAEIMGRQSGVCGGVGGSQHLCHREFNFYSNGIQGGIVPNAVGMALAEKVRGSGSIVAVFLGDGTMGEGAVYESFNLASLWSLPVLFVIENNQYAQSTPVALAQAGQLIDRPRAFGIETAELGMRDPEDVLAAGGQAVSFVRGQDRPFALLLNTYRLGPHSKGDDTRDLAEVSYHKSMDPLLCQKAKLGEDAARRIEQKCRQQIQQAIAAAEASPLAVRD